MSWTGLQRDVERGAPSIGLLWRMYHPRSSIESMLMEMFTSALLAVAAAAQVVGMVDMADRVRLEAAQAAVGRELTDVERMTVAPPRGVHQQPALLAYVKAAS